MTGRRTVGQVIHGLVIVAGLGALAVSGLLALAIVQGGDPVVRTDLAARAVWERRVEPSLKDLNAVPRVAGLKPEGPARVYPCVVDSGEVLGLSAGRVWQPTTRSRAQTDAGMSEEIGSGFMHIEEFLKHRGWRAVRREAELGGPLPSGVKYDTIFFRSGESPTIHAVMQGHLDGVLVTVSFKDAPEGCSVAD